MSNRFKIWVRLALFGLLIIGATDAVAQVGNHTHSFVLPQCATGASAESTILVGNRLDVGTGDYVDNVKVQAITLNVLEWTDDTHTETNVTMVSRLTSAETTKNKVDPKAPFIGSNNASFIEYILQNTSGGVNTRLGYSTYRMHDLTVWLNNAPASCVGKTIQVVVEYGSSLTSIESTYTYQLDVLGAPDIETDDVKWVDEQGAYVLEVCKGDVVDFTINNEEFPFGEQYSVLGFKYRAEYRWDYKINKGTMNSFPIDDDAHRDNCDDHHIYDETLTSGASKVYTFQPKIAWTIIDEEENEIPGCTSPMSSIVVDYNNEVELEIELNEEGVDELTVCDGTQVTLTAVLQKDGLDFEEDGEVFLYAISEDFADTTEIDMTDDYNNIEFDLGELEAKDGKNTIYHYALAFHDMTEGWDVADCWTYKPFTVIVLEKDVEVDFEKDDDGVCENSDLEIVATLTGNSLSDYICEWSGEGFTINGTSTFYGDKATLTDKNISYNGGKRVYNLTIWNGDKGLGCYVIEQVEVITHEQPKLTPIQAVVQDCIGEEVEIGVTADQTDLAFTWTPDEGEVVAGSAGARRLVEVLNHDVKYTVTAVNTITGCESKQNADITVKYRPLPVITYVGASKPIICKGGETTLTATLDASYHPDGELEYLWRWTEGGAAKSQTTSTNQMTFSPSESVTVSVSVTDNHSCESPEERDVNITVNELPTFTIKTVDACDGLTGTFTMSDATLGYVVTPLDGGSVSVVGNVCTVKYEKLGNTSPLTYKFKVTGTDYSTGCSTTKDVTMKINPLPIVSVQSDAASYCVDDEIELTSNVSPSTGVTYAWVGEGVQSPTSANTVAAPTSSGSKTYTLTVTITATGCSASASKTVTVNELPVASISGPTVICEGENATLSGPSGDYQYLWSNGATTPSITVNPSSTTTYTLIITSNATGCSSEEVKHVLNVNKKPVFTVTPSPAEVCQGSNDVITFTTKVTNGMEVSTYTWTPFVTGSGNSYTYSETWSSDKNFSVVAYTASGCKSDPVPVTIKVNPKPATPVATASPAMTCETKNTKVTLSVTSPVPTYEYEWFDGTTSLGTGTSKSVTPAATTTYTVVAKDKAHPTLCSSDPSTVTVTVNPLPVASITASDDEICEGESVTLTGVSGDYTYSWSTSASTPSIDVQPKSTTTYKLTITNKTTGCTSAEVSKTITVNQKPVVKLTLNPTQVCNGSNETIILTPSVTNGVKVVSYDWNVAGVTDNHDGTFSVTKVWTSNQTFEVTALSEKSCESAAATATLKVNNLPDAPVAKAGDPICKDSGKSITLSVTAQSGYTYEWYSDVHASDKLATGTTYSVTPNETTTYYVLSRDNVTKCASSVTSVTAVVNVLPSVSITASESEVCEGTTVRLTGASGSFDYVWSTGEKTNYIDVTPSATTTYSLYVKDKATGCASESTYKEIVVNQKPVITITATPDAICDGETAEVILSVDVDNDVVFSDYKWDDASVKSKSAESFSVSQKWTATKTYNVIATSNKGCKSVSVPVTILVNPKPAKPVLAAVPTAICEGSGDKVTLSVNGPVSGYTYKWFVGSTEVGTGSSITQSPTESTDYTVIAYDDNYGTSCQSDEATISVEVVANPGAPVITSTSDNVCSADGTIINLAVDSPDSKLTYIWHSNDGEISTGVSVNVTPTTSNAYYVVAKNSTNCLSEKSNNINVNVDKSPVLALGSSESITMCQYTTSTLSVDVVEGDELEFFWSDGTSGDDVEELEYEGKVPGLYTITVYAKDKNTGCKSNTLTFNINVVAAPTYTLKPDDLTVCEGDDITLEATSSSTALFSWGEILKGNTEADYKYSGNPVTFTPVKDAKYVLQIIDMNTWCQIVDTLGVKVFSNPDISLDGKTEYCVGSNIDVKVVSNDGETYSYVWKKGGVVVSTGAELKVASATTEYDGEYVITVTNSNGCSTDVPVSIVVYEKPTTTIDGDDYVCYGNQFTLSAADDSFKTYEWSVNGVDESGDVELIYNAAGDEVGKIYNISLIVTDNNECVSEPITATVTVRDLPKISSVSGIEDCLVAGETITMVPALSNKFSTSTYTYHWKNLAGKYPEKDTDESGLEIDRDSKYAGEWEVYAVEDNTGCTGSAYTFNVVLHNITDVVISSNSDKFCKGSGSPLEVSMTVASDEDASTFKYSYSLLDASNSVIDSKDNQGDSYSYDLSALELGSYTLTVTAKSPFGCTKSESKTFKVVVAPDNALASNIPACFGGEVVFTAEADNAEYEFFVNGSSVGLQQSNVFKSSSLNEGDEVYAIVDNGNCKTETEHKTVAYLEPFNPELTIKNGDSKICENEVVTYLLKSSTLNIVSYKVFVNGSLVSSEDVTASKEVEFTYATDDDYDVYVVAVSEEGCEFTTDKVVPSMSHVAVDDLTLSTTDVCLDATFVATANVSGAVDGNYKYEFEFNGQNSGLISENNYEFTASSIGTFDVNVTVHDVDAECSSTENSSVTVHELPVAELNVTSHSPVAGNSYAPCAADKFEFSIAGSIFVVNVDGVDGVRYDSDGASYVDDSDIFKKITYSSNKFQLGFDYADGEKTVYVTVIDPLTGCESKSNEIKVKFHDAITMSVPDPYVISDNVLQMCQGDNTTLTVSADDVNASDYVFNIDGSSVSGTNVYTVTAVEIGTKTLEIVASNGCSTSLSIVTNEAPKPVVELKVYDNNGDLVAADIDASSVTKVCSNEDFNITVSGGSSFEMTVTRDGDDVTSDFDVTSIASSSFVNDYSLEYVPNDEGTNNYNEYVFNYTVKVGTCVDHASQTVRVYKLPVADLTVDPGKLVISGTDVKLTTTAGYVNYEYFVDGISVSSSSDNTYTISALDHDATVSVIVTSEFGCSITLTDEIKVLEGIAPKDVVVSSDYYCSESNGVTISVLNPQVGITYVLKECTSCPPILCADSETQVAWDDIRIVNGINPFEYSVYAYHASLPDETVDMNNTVKITEVATPSVFNLTPDIVRTRCDAGDVIKLDGSEPNVYYVLYLDGNPVFGPIEGNADGEELVFTEPTGIGTYTIRAYSQYDASMVCEVEMNGKYIIDLPKAVEFEVTSDPLNGNLCIDGDKAEIKLSGSEVDKVYYLLKDGDYIVNGADTVKVVGTGDALSFGSYNESGHYTVACHFNGCMSMMSGSADIKVFDLPLEQTVSVSNYGHYCEGDEGVTITVGGQQEEYLYTLFLNGNDTGISHIGDDSGSSFDFTNLTEVGKYTVGVTIPTVESGCELKLNTAINVVMDKLPVDIVLQIGSSTQADTICSDDHTTISLYNTEYGVEYRLLLDGNQVAIHVDDEGVGYFTFDDIAEEGVYTVEAVKTYDVDGEHYTTCPKIFDSEVSLTVVSRPLESGQVEVLGTETPADKLAADPCYGVDIYVDNAQAGLIYELFMLDEHSELINKSLGKFVAVGDVNVDRFMNIQNNDGWYRVLVSNGYCYDALSADQHVENTKYVTIQKVIADEKLCRGDLGNPVSLAASEIGVTYILYGPGDEVLETVVASGTNGFTFESLIYNEGHYYVTGQNTLMGGCEVRMVPEIDLVVNSLPVSYQLSGFTSYCGTQDGVELKLSGSELGVDYVLYRVNDNGTLKQVETKKGSGSELTFSKVTEGTYEAAARNADTKCTSSMLGRVVITMGQDIAPITLDADTVRSCGSYEFVISSNLTSGATYYMVPGDASPEDIYYLKSEVSDGTTPVKFMMEESGEYAIWASYENFSCMTEVGSLVFEMNSIKNYVVTSNSACAGVSEVLLSGSEDGIEYFISDEYETYVGDGEPIVWNVNGSGYQTFTVFAKKETCVFEMGSVEIDFSKSVAPKLTLTMLVNGDEAVDSALVCPSAMVWFYSTTEGISVKNYHYVLRDMTGNVVYERYNAPSGYIAKPTKFAAGDTLTMTVDVLSDNNCEYKSLDSKTFVVMNSELDGNRLIALNDEYSYCEGEAGVTLAFLDVDKGVTYRLWKFTEEDESDLDLVDIQELPYYHPSNHEDMIKFNGWSFNSEEYRQSASAGSYYVTLDSSDGCNLRSNVVVVTENPLPQYENNEVYYAIIDKNGEIDLETKNESFGLLNTGYIVLEGARKDVTYQLVHLGVYGNIDAILQTKTTSVDSVQLVFGPISDKDNSGVDTTDVNVWGEGEYTIRAIDNITGCTVDLGLISFIDEELVTYDVYLFLNKSQSSTRKILIPMPGRKGNKQYIDWSTKVDIAYMPEIDTIAGTINVISDEVEDLYESGTGYTSIRKNANIMFEILEDMPSIIYLDSKEPGCDSVVVATSYEYFKQYTDTATGSTITMKLPSAQDGCDSVAISTYKYFKSVVKEYAGTFGFDDYTGSTDLLKSSKTGCFVYRKAPNFYGQERIPYRVYNTKMPNVRTSIHEGCHETELHSGISYITILCGNNDVPDDESQFLVPNAFSPNGDGFNDEYRILLPVEYIENHTSKLEVFNRWGTLVYRSSGLRYGYDCPWWDGNSKSSNMLTLGDKLPQGTYFYVFTIDFNIDGEVKTRKLHGYIELRR